VFFSQSGRDRLRHWIQHFPRFDGSVFKLDEKMI
jgi:hypothetical protein